MIRYSGVVSRNEILGTEGNLYPHLSSAGYTYVEPDIAMTITILDKMLEPNAHDRLTPLGCRDLIPRVRGSVIARESGKSFV